jgi:hypothetical protein
MDVLTNLENNVVYTKIYYIALFFSPFKLFFYLFLGFISLAPLYITPLERENKNPGPNWLSSLCSSLVIYKINHIHVEILEYSIK